MKKLSDTRSSRAHADTGRGGKSGDTHDSSGGTRDLYSSLSLSSKVDGHPSRAPHSVQASASPKLSAIKSLPMSHASSSSAPPSSSTFSSSIAAPPSRSSSESVVLPVQASRTHPHHFRWSLIAYFSVAGCDGKHSPVFLCSSVGYPSHTIHNFRSAIVSAPRCSYFRGRCCRSE
jgi:hypothetical protein